MPSSSSATPLVTVLLPVYNAGPYLAETIESILAQTLTDFEFIIIDDCSTDDSLAVAQRYVAQDARVTVLANDRNRGRAHADNRGHALARGRYIAKMDADDIALPHRLQRQADFLTATPQVGLISSYLQAFGASDVLYQYPLLPDEVRSFLLFNMPVGNPAVFFRQELLTQFSLDYDESILDTFGEDYEWVARVARVTAIQNLPEVLLRYRTFPAAHKADVHARRTAKANLIREKLLQQAGFTFSPRELRIHNIVAHYPFVLGDITLAEVHSWLLSLAAQNEHLHYAAPAALRQVLAERWFWTCYHNPDRATNSYRAFRRAALSRDFTPDTKLRAKFWLKNNVLRRLRRS
jgi:glycosyltransferase involved in cell wall biosynthesis